jgi:hypothetical protein
MKRRSAARARRLSFVVAGWLAASLVSPGGAASPDVLVDQHSESPAPGQQDVEVSLHDIERNLRAGEDVALINAMNGSWSRTVRASAAMALGGFRSPAALDALARGVSDPNDWVRMGSIGALSYAGGAGAVAVLHSLSQAPDDAFADILPSARKRVTPGEPLPFQTLGRGTGSAHASPAWLAIDTRDAWHTLWAGHSLEEPVPVIDFSKDRALAFFGGANTGTSEVEILAIERKTDFQRVLVKRVQGDSPEKSSAFHFVKLRRSDLPLHWVQLLSGRQ